MAIAIAAAFILPDLPHNSKGFTEEELQVAQMRMTEDVGEADADSAEQGALDGFYMAVKDYKIYLMMITFTTYVIGLSFNAYFVSHHRVICTSTTNHVLTPCSLPSLAPSALDTSPPCS